MLTTIKLLAKVFYHFDDHWYSSHGKSDWQNVRVVIILNHTSLFEPLFVRDIPLSFLWRLSNKLILPGADTTLKRPIVGKTFRILVPKCIPISRKYDESWNAFLNQIEDDSNTAILPEGRMKRSSGLDKDGNQMSIRPGVVDI